MILMFALGQKMHWAGPEMYLVLVLSIIHFFFLLYFKLQLPFASPSILINLLFTCIYKYVNIYFLFANFLPLDPTILF
jgi:hypothetical protein